MSFGSGEYPVFYFDSDTTGEKAYEEFYVAGEKINMDRFSALGVIEKVNKRSMLEIDTFFNEIENIFSKSDLLKKRWWKPSNGLFLILNMRRKGSIWIRKCR